MVMNCVGGILLGVGGILELHGFNQDDRIVEMGAHATVLLSFALMGLGCCLAVKNTRQIIANQAMGGGREFELRSLSSASGGTGYQSIGTFGAPGWNSTSTVGSDESCLSLGGSKAAATPVAYAV